MKVHRPSTGGGNTQVVEAGKQAMMQRTGLPGRDLRILDPVLSYPSTVVGRERAMVINLEHIKAIICANEVLLLNSSDPSVMAFVEELQRRILHHHHANISSQVRDELEHLLDDDEDMAEMYLSDKLLQQHLENSSASSIIDDDDQDIELDNNDRMHPEISIENGRVDSRRSKTTTTKSGAMDRLDVHELQMLLEAYFVQIDGSLNKLSTLREYVDDTEDYINIMLDDKQNQLLQMGVMLSMATLVISCFIVVCGVLGINIHIDLFDPTKNGMTQWLQTTFGGVAGCIILYVVAFIYIKHKGLLG